MDNETVIIDRNKWGKTVFCSRNGNKCALGFWMEQNRGMKFEPGKRYSYEDIPDEIDSEIDMRFGPGGFTIANPSDDHNEAETIKAFAKSGITCKFV